ncbi:MAG: hypothetical protein ACI9K2_000754 [Myxococcota bacterium]
MYTDRAAALGRLAALGFDYDETLDIQLVHPRIGTIDRLFGLLGNLYEARAKTADAALIDHLLELVDDPDNHDVRSRLRSRAIPHTPINKRTLRSVDSLLHSRGVHLPWAFRPMNADLGLVLSRRNAEQAFSFGIVYCQNVEFTELMEAVPGRLFSLPIGTDPTGTWDETIYDHLLDEDVGFMVEVDLLVTEA